MLPGFRLGDRHSEEFAMYMLSALPQLTAPIETRSNTTPDQHGAYYFASKYAPLYLPLEVAIDARQMTDLHRNQREISAWLSPTRGQQRLILDAEPDKYYSAVLDGQTQISRLVAWGRTTLTFFVADPFAYAVEDDVFSSSAGEIAFQRQGTAESNSLIEIQGQSNAESGFQLQVNDQEVTYTGELGMGEKLVMDSQFLTAYIELPTGEKRSALNGIEPLDFPITLPHVENVLRITPLGTAALSNVKITCRSRWY